MCGICGYLNSSKSSPAGPALLKAMNDRMLHRGPDGEGFYLGDDVALAMRRLAVIDLQGGDQPVFNEAGNIAVVFNGEIYNFRDLRHELETAGHVFRSNCDTEVIVHAYEQWGDDALQRFNGMFAIALWDIVNRRLLLARDAMGQKPLFWHDSGQCLLWASESRLLQLAPWVGREINPIALHHYLSLQYIPDPNCIISGIQKLPAGYKLVVEGNLPPKVEQWWKLRFTPKTRQNQSEVFEESRRLISAAVDRCMISDRPLGVYLSGGMDSAIVAAEMARLSTGPVRAYTIGFAEKEFSEATQARQMAEYLGIEFTEYQFSTDSLVDCMEQALRFADEPLADPAALPLYQLAENSKSEIVVALTGDGGDETLAGYTRYLVDPLANLCAYLPQPLLRFGLSLVTKFLSVSNLTPEDRDLSEGLRRLSFAAATSQKASLVRWGSYFSAEQRAGLYTDRWRDELASQSTVSLLEEHFDQALATSYLDRTLYTDHQTYLSGDLLPKTDRMTMAHSMEARAPFLDKDWVEWTARLPARYKAQGLRTKRLLRGAFSDSIPADVLKRGKRGFGVPIGHWMRTSMKDWTRERLLGNSELNTWFKTSSIESLLKEHQEGSTKHGKRLWALVVFSTWLEHQRKLVSSKL